MYDDNMVIDEGDLGMAQSNNRLTKEWTETLDEAFGPRGKKGRLGEEFLCRVFEKWGWDYNHFPDCKEKQLTGIDIEFKKPGWNGFFNCDSKNNMDKFGRFQVHKEWLFKVECHRIWHNNPDTGWMTWYPVDKMRSAYDHTKEYMVFTPRTRLDFMTSRQTVV
jgi:hypothetical protein|tara:strand:- start:953 stop:1441 length:489 start_codon:yes stop_codon:yes gene_type:complete